MSETSQVETTALGHELASGGRGQGRAGAGEKEESRMSPPFRCGSRVEGGVIY